MILDLIDADVAKVVYEVPPGIVEPADPGDEGDDRADLEAVGVDPAAAD